MIEHPDITSAQWTGRPVGASQENQDRTDYRKEYAEEHFSEFLDFAQAGQPDILDEFIEHYQWKYKSWLN